MSPKVDKAIEQLSPAEIKKRFPKEFRELQESLKEKAKKSRPDLPSKILKELEEERDALWNGVEIRVPPSKKYPFEVRFCARLEYDEVASIEEAEVFAAPAQTPAEKRLIRMLRDALGEHDGVYSYDGLMDELYRSPEVKDVNRRILNLRNQLKELSKRYNFEPDCVLN